MNLCIFSGNVGTAPETKTTEAGLTIARFSIAVNEFRKNESGEKETVTNWIRLVAFGKRAETISKFVEKGTRLTVQAKVNVSKWTNEEGENKSAVEFIVQNFEFAGSAQKSESNEAEESREALDLTEDPEDDLPF